MVFKGQWIVIDGKSLIHVSIFSFVIGFHNYDNCSVKHDH